MCVCVSVCKKRRSFFFFSWLGVPTVFAGLLCVGEVCVCVWVKVGHQGKEFNKSCRKRSGSAISERRPGRETGSQVSEEHSLHISIQYGGRKRTKTEINK